MSGCGCTGGTSCARCLCKPDVVAAAERVAGTAYDPTCYSDPDPLCFQKSLAQRFIPLANRLRNMAVQPFGARLYRVRILHIRYPAGYDRYTGEPYVAKEIPILPIPKVDGIGSLDRSVTGVGTHEIGSVTVSKINAELSEEDLTGFPPGQHAFDPNQAAFYEITYLGKQTTWKRRFQLAGPPERELIGWKVTLIRATDDRQLSGEVQLPS